MSGIVKRLHGVPCFSPVEPLEPRRLFATGTHTQLLASASNPALGQDVVFTATVTPDSPGAVALTGFVRFREGLTFLGKVAIGADGKAALSLYHLFNGGHTIVARYVGNDGFEASVSRTNITVVQGTTQSRPDGLETSTITPGTGGAGVANDQSLQVNYTGYLADGTKFDSSLNPGRTPLNFVLGKGSVIKGWDDGLLGMKANETRLLVIPPALAYGSTPRAGVPINSTLFFIVRMLSFQATTAPIVLVTGANVTPVRHGANPSAQNGTDLGAVAVGSASVTTTILLSSGNDAELMFTEDTYARLTGANPGRFTFGEPVGDGNGNFAMTVRFTPLTTGVRRARIDIFTNDSVHPTFHIRLVGTGV